MADPLEDLLRRSPLTQSQRAEVWDAYEGAQDADALAVTLGRLNVPKQVKAGLWDLKEASAKTAPPAVQEEAFPTPGETAGTFAGGALRSLPGMAMGAVEGAAAPIMAVPGEIGALVTGGPSPTMAQWRESAGHVRNAFAPGDAGPGRRMAEAVSAIPGVAPIVQGAETIFTPAYKTATEGVGTVTPGEMNAAAETGGAATAGLALPEVAKGVGKITPATVGNVLKFTAKHAAMEGVAPGGTTGGRLVTQFVTGPLMRKAGTILQDALFEAIAQRDLPRAAGKILQFLERNPEAAATYAEDVAKAAGAEPAAASAAPAVAAPAVEPVKSFAPTDSSPAAVEARNAAKRARGPLAKRQARAETSSTVVATPVVEQAVSTLEKRATMPEKGNVTMPSVSTKPATKPITGRPLTPKQREMRLKQLEAAQAAGLDIWEAFGVEKD